MAKLDRVAVCVALTGTLLSSIAYGDDAAKCDAAKLKIAGKYELCRAKAWAKLAKAGNTGTPDFTKCDPAFSAKWSAAETKGNGQCPSNGDEVSIQQRIVGDSQDLATLLSGAYVTVCGNGVIEVGESCDFNNLNGMTCQSLGFVAGQLSCTNTCDLDTSGCFATRFVDNGDGTVTDHKTGLMWEKKTGTVGTFVNCSMTLCADPHDVNNTYSYGTAYTDFLAKLNNGDSSDGTAITGCFAGDCDWRLPTSAELQTILLAPNPCGTHPCIDPAFGPTVLDLYWSATTLAGFPFRAWMVNFIDGFVFHNDKGANIYVRAVRGGS
jgi:hypothetical protein